MNPRFQLLASLLLSAGTVGAGTAVAQPVINEKALPKGMTKADAAAIAAALDKSNAEALAKRDAEFKGALDAGGAMLADVQKKAQALATSNSSYRTFVSTQKSIASSKAADRAARLTQHYEKNKALLEKLYALAGGSVTKDPESVLLKLRSVSPAVKRAGDKLLGYVDQAKPPIPRPGSPVTLTFSPPFAIATATTSEVGDQGITEESAAVSPTSSVMALHAVAYLGDCRCVTRATTAVFVDVPAGKSRMSVKVEYQYNYTLHADAGDVRGAQAQYISFVNIREVSSNSTILANTGDLIFGSAGATATAYMTSVDLQETASATNEGAVDRPVVAGRRYLVSFVGSGSAQSVPAGFVSVDASVTPTSFEIELK